MVVRQLSVSGWLLFIVIALGSCGATFRHKSGSGSVQGPVQQTWQTAWALEHAASAYEDPEFWEIVKERGWLVSLASGEIWTGEQVKDRLRKVNPKNLHIRIKTLWSCWSFVPFYMGTCNASTTSCTGKWPQCGTIHLNRDYVKDVEAEQPSYLINTIAHETTHVLGRGSEECGCEESTKPLFVDSGTRKHRHEVWLVSYGIGDLAECFYKEQGDPGRTRHCFANILNGKQCNRRIVECCPSTAGDSKPVSQALVRLRDESPWCKEVICPTSPEQATCGYKSMRTRQ